jgi:hypothetical protein
MIFFNFESDPIAALKAKNGDFIHLKHIFMSHPELFLREEQIK